MADLITVELDKKRTTQALPSLVVKQGTGPEVVGKIMAAVRLAHRRRTGIASGSGGGAADAPQRMERPLW